MTLGHREEVPEEEWNGKQGGDGETVSHKLKSS